MKHVVCAKAEAFCRYGNNIGGGRFFKITSIPPRSPQITTLIILLFPEVVEVVASWIQSFKREESSKPSVYLHNLKKLHLSNDTRGKSLLKQWPITITSISLQWEGP